MKVCIVGGGVMGEAILGAAVTDGVIAREAVTVVEKLPARREHLQATWAVSVTDDFAAMAGASHPSGVLGNCCRWTDGLPG